MKEMIKRFLKDEEGANMVEYALLVALVGVLLIVTIVALTGGIGKALNSATEKLGGTKTDPSAAPS